ncbi:MAG: cupin domain-containing protein [Pirellulaceae bacterium]
MPVANQTSSTRSSLDPVGGPPAPFEVVNFAALEPVACPCGWARRAFSHVPDFPGTVHVTEISEEARLHYHRTLIETYYFLECGPEARMQLDQQILPVHPGMCLLIRPGTRHRALGRMKVLIVVFPKFDPHDEWFD